MPTYATKCPQCRFEKDIRLQHSEYDAVKNGSKRLACSECESTCEIVFSPGRLSMSFLDGESGGWATKAMKENAFRAGRANTMQRREASHVFKPKLVPNYNGAEAPSWKDAQEAARADKGIEAAATYAPMVNQEKSK